MSAQQGDICSRPSDIPLGLKLLSGLETTLIVISLPTVVVFTVTIIRYRLLTSLSRILLLNEVICSYGYLSLRLVLLFDIVFNDTYSVDIRQSAVWIVHDVFISAKYNNISQCGFVLFVFSMYTDANFGRKGEFFGLCCASVPWIFGLMANLLDNEFAATDYYQLVTILVLLGTTCSLLLTFPFKSRLARMYAKHKFDLHRKTRISMQLRSLSILKLTLSLSLARLYIGVPILATAYVYLLPRCMLTESRYVGAIHDIMFESFDVIIPFWVLKNEPLLRKQIPFYSKNNPRLSPLKNALGQRINVVNTADRHFQDLLKMWE